MLEFFIVGYSLYFFMVTYTSFMQVDFVKKAKKRVPVILQEQKYEEAGQYSVEKERVNMVSSLYDFALFIVWIGVGLSLLSDATQSIENPIYKAVVFVDSFIVINWFLGLPFSLYSAFVLDKKYGFSNMTPALFIKDTLKTTVLFLLFGSAVIAGVAWIIHSFSNWWIWGFVFIFSVIILINMLYPLVRQKMFDKFEPLSDKELESKIEKLLESVDFKSSGVFSVDASKRDNRLNAYFGGLGSTKRVVLFDTLIQKLSHNELLAVLGHELGHFKNGDIVKNIGVMGAVMFIFFALFGNLPDTLYMRLGVSDDASGVIVLFLIFSPFLSFFLMPLISMMSRKNEYAADEFGSQLQSKEDLVSALLKLANENKSFPLSHPLYVFFYYSHPPLVQRLKKLGYKLENIDEALEQSLQEKCQ